MPSKTTSTETIMCRLAPLGISCGDFSDGLKDGVSMDASLSAKFEPLHERFRKASLPHARLYFPNFIRHTPKFDGLVVQVGDRERSARVCVARLANRAGVQEISFVRLYPERGKKFSWARANLQNFQIVVEVRKSALMMCVPEKRDSGCRV